MHRQNIESKCKLFLLTKELSVIPMGGREMLSKLNFFAFSSELQNNLILFELKHSKPINILDVLNTFCGHIDGLNTKIIGQALEQISRENVTHVFVDGSNLGGFVAILKYKLPHVQVITFFHNVEARFFWGSFRSCKSIRALVILIVNYLAERKATIYSDKLVCLSERDSQLLRSIYGKGATHIAPMILEDKFTAPPKEAYDFAEEHFALFVGGNFYANREGISWFVKNVATRIDIKICIVGKGMDDIRSELEIPGRVVVVGPVDNLESWYRRARFVIAPIFDGSGMKTKVAEAMMHGKKVVGTPEAFSGYEFASEAGWICQTADDFVEAISQALEEIHDPFDESLRSLYLNHYSFQAGVERLNKILL